MAAPHCLLVSRCWGACDHLRARDPTEHRLHFPRCGAEYVPGASGPRAQLPARSTSPPPAIPAHTLTPPVTTTLTLYSIVAK